MGYAWAVVRPGTRRQARSAAVPSIVHQFEAPGGKVSRELLRAGATIGPQANSYRYYEPDGSTDVAGSFSYWTDPVDSYTTANGLGIGDSSYNIVGPGGLNVPAPWVPFTRAGCNVGEVALADLDLENALPDAAVVFGQGSPEAQLAASNPSSRLPWPTVPTPSWRRPTRRSSRRSGRSASPLSLSRRRGWRAGRPPTIRPTSAANRRSRTSGTSATSSAIR
jgi:hypothetical protein